MFAENKACSSPYVKETSRILLVSIARELHTMILEDALTFFFSSSLYV